MAYPPPGPQGIFHQNTPVMSQFPPGTDPRGTYTIVPAPVPLPPQDMYPCGCKYPGPHESDCMWSLWEQMRDNYQQTKTLMCKFMKQTDGLQIGEQGENVGRDQEIKCDCYRKNLAEATGLSQLQGVTLPWLQPDVMPGLQSGPTNTGMVYENEARKMMEDQKRIKNMWAQFLNIFDMALELADDASKARWEANKRRKERAKLEREQKLEEIRQQRKARCAALQRPHDKKPSADSKKEVQPKKAKKEEKSYSSPVKQSTRDRKSDEKNETPEEPKEETPEEFTEEKPAEPQDKVQYDAEPVSEENEPETADQEPPEPLEEAGEE